MSNLAKCQIYKNCPDVKFYDTNSLREINATSVDLDTNGKFVVVHDDDGSTYYVDSGVISVEENFLEVPGLGYLKPGTKVVLDTDKTTTYVLNFGWHTNVSNQTIYSWYLRPITEVVNRDEEEYMSKSKRVLSQDKTLYREMIDHLWRVTV